MSLNAPFRLAALFLLITVPNARVASGQSSAPPATIRGTVLDRAGGSPIGDVLVELQDVKQSVTTDDAGRFELTNVQPGRRTLYVSLVGFILVKRPIAVAAGETADVTIVLSEGTGSYSEEVTVRGDRFPEQEKAVPSQQTLGSAEIQNLRTLLTNDPLRAIQVLPGVTTGDDFRAEFAVRGSGFGRMNFVFDGIPSPFLLHTVQQEEDGGSIAMVNGDILDAVTLMNGAYPQRYGNRIGAQLDFHMREGSRARTQVRAGVSGTDASIVAEGPLGRGKRGSWLVSARKSYLELLIRQISDDSDFGFGFSDAQAKAAYDVSRRHRLELTLIAGQSRLDQQAGPNDGNEIHDGRNTAQLAAAAWRFTASPSLALTQRLAVAGDQFLNTNVSDVELGQGEARDLTWRGDVVAQVSPALSIEGGGQVQRQMRQEVRREFDSARVLRTRQSYDDTALLTSGYAQAGWAWSTRASVTMGGRIDRWSLTGDTQASPWAQARIALGGSLSLRAGAGIHRQFPDFFQVLGSRAGTALVPERARQADAGLEQTIFNGNGRWQVTFYDRRERDLLRLPGTEFHVVDGRLIGPSQTTRWVNALDGYARGVEFLLQRRSASGVSGWVSYSLGFNRYHDQVSNESFDGDFDQRHTFNAYGVYRATNRLSLAAKLRMGSNTPALGYWERRGDEYFVGSERNLLRVPSYARLDIRVNRTFNWQSKRLTLFVELLNTLGRSNERFNLSSLDGRTHQVFGLFETLIPRVPSAGILLEF